MALVVKYEEIRTNVIPALAQDLEEMQTVHKNLKNTVDTLTSTYMAGDASNAYADEFEKAIAQIFKKMENNIQSYNKQLEDICAEFEARDAEISEALNSNIIS